MYVFYTQRIFITKIEITYTKHLISKLSIQTYTKNLKFIIKQLIFLLSLVMFHVVSCNGILQIRWTIITKIIMITWFVPRQKIPKIGKKRKLKYNIAWLLNIICHDIPFWHATFLNLATCITKLLAHMYHLNLPITSRKGIPHIKLI